MIKEFKVPKSKKGTYRMGLFGGSTIINHPEEYAFGKGIIPRLKHESEGVYRNYFVNLYLIKFEVHMNFYKKLLL